MIRVPLPGLRALLASLLLAASALPFELLAQSSAWALPAPDACIPQGGLAPGPFEEDVIEADDVPFLEGDTRARILGGRLLGGA